MLFVGGAEGSGGGGDVGLPQFLSANHFGLCGCRAVIPSVRIQSHNCGGELNYQEEAEEVLFIDIDWVFLRMVQHHFPGDHLLNSIAINDISVCGNAAIRVSKHASTYTHTHTNAFRVYACVCVVMALCPILGKFPLNKFGQPMERFVGYKSKVLAIS